MLWEAFSLRSSRPNQTKLKKVAETMAEKNYISKNAMSAECSGLQSVMYYPIP